MNNLSEITMPHRCKLIVGAYKNWLKKNDKVLDIGCGNGTVGNSLIKNLGIKIIGCDIENYLLYKLQFVKIQGDKLPFSNKSFDAVLLNDVLHHIDKEKQIGLLKEASRIGKSILIFEAKPTLYGSLADIILNKFHYGKLDTPLSFRTTNDWKRLFKGLKLTYDVKEIEKPFWYPFSHIAFILQKK